MFSIQSHFGPSQVSVCSSANSLSKGDQTTDYKSQLFTPPKKKQVWTGVTYSKKSVYYTAKLEGVSVFRAGL